jgi:hypothetical protein
MQHETFFGTIGGTITAIVINPSLGSIIFTATIGATVSFLVTYFLKKLFNKIFKN